MGAKPIAIIQPPGIQEAGRRSKFNESAGWRHRHSGGLAEQLLWRAARLLRAREVYGDGSIEEVEQARRILNVDLEAVIDRVAVLVGSR
ncbi:MAG: hypothetical protein QOG72_369 [Sphingomonadales bacterium]|nr:hypothetical protein [Sphingomonadales bacterium]